MVFKISMPFSKSYCIFFFFWLLVCHLKPKNHAYIREFGKKFSLTKYSFYVVALFYMAHKPKDIYLMGDQKWSCCVIIPKAYMCLYSFNQTEHIL